ncbi:tryptophan 2,3-dioxygenase [Streptomyces albiaxialis]|uniref:Tryptophan 2,3-dioxygenase n=1 Tax=Streptomyces albiaxialis TaxID=329523 RepID=A0ABP5HRS6_9ACTN
MVSAPPTPYEEYIRVDELLALHSPRTDAPGEDLFIAVHQVSELWLATLLRETGDARRMLLEEDTEGAARRLRTAVDVLGQLTGTLNVLCGMLPTEFARFRTELGTASAAQSPQFARVIKACRGPGPSLWDAFAALAEGQGGLVKIYDAVGGGPREVAELLVDLDDAFGAWMSAHWRLVSRQIGAAMGTAGQSAALLRERMEARLFPALLDVRPEFHRAEEVPAP